MRVCVCECVCERERRVSRSVPRRKINEWRRDIKKKSSETNKSQTS
jgi:hypothetical protein